ncbi:hypothetical protein DYY67_0301 [Candidatus Nitrosotalea sp. TS]|uniref:hypothetical protein n=1 Tax=Candidatus Nitrosotalea sp. TS TaxID=2341020 RepID=UPI00140869C6|nr:hypothetical protein [Candidatus Nitrosotalea sp. TS]NHI03180.1 hypothetical protein [Candidatus Nitrosotalea sp. TS]
MAKVKINLSCGEIVIEFTDMNDLEEQLKKMDFPKIDLLLNAKKNEDTIHAENSKNTTIPDVDNIVKELGTINLLKMSERGQDAIKLAIFLAASGMNREEIKKVTGITILSS